MYIKDIEPRGVKWIHLAQNGDPENSEIFVRDSGAIAFSRATIRRRTSRLVTRPDSGMQTRQCTQTSTTHKQRN